MLPVGWDQQVLFQINRSGSPLARFTLGTADRTAYPIYYGVLPAAWALSLARGSDHSAAVELSASAVGAYGVAILMKRLVGRERPNAVLPWVVSRTRYPGGRDLDPHSWPSGHATMAAAIGTSIALTYPRASVPLGIWAGAVGVSRVWLGVHYPSDVLSGWLIGAGTAWLVHELRNPAARASSDAVMPPIVISLPFR